MISSNTDTTTASTSTSCAIDDITKSDISITVISLCIVSFLILYCYRIYSKKSRKDLESKLNDAQRCVSDLEHQLASLQHADSENGENDDKPIRIWMDGAFDMMHYGHMNAFRLGRSLGTHLIVGVNSDETITACKGEPITNDAERYDTVRACKWVDQVVTGVPYIMNEEYLLHVIDKYKIDYVVHGDDPCVVDGKDVYESARKLGKYLTIPRTEGISTTDIVGRMLLMTRSHHSPSFDGSSSSSSQSPDSKLASRSTAYYKPMSQFLTTSSKIRIFGAGVKPPSNTDRVVYVAGSWDMFTACHVKTLEKAREYGNYVIAGVYGDMEVNNRRGINLPIMNLNERVLSCLGCKFVDDVLIEAPFAVTKDMISSLNISIVIVKSNDPYYIDGDGDDPYAIPKSMGITETIISDDNMSVLTIIDRLQSQRDRYMEKYAKKKKAESEYYDDRYKRV